MNIKDTRADTIMEYLCRIMLIGTLIYLIVCWSTIPDQIPTHYNAAGEIDDWGGKGMIWFTVIILLTGNAAFWLIRIFLARN